MVSGATPGDAGQRAAEPVRLRGLNCPNCGAAIQLRGFQYTQRIICDSCCATLDATDPNFTVLQKFDERLARARPLIPLGTRGQWKGESWEVIGFQQRTITVEGIAYAWHEYLLFNPYLGVRYLTQYDGHWSDVTTLRALPVLGAEGGRPTARWRDRQFKAFQTAVAVTSFALGEFPWALAVGDRVVAQDFVSPPFMLSSESTEEEVTWSLGEYVSGERVWQAFNLEGTPPGAQGVYANQPNPLADRPSRTWRTFGALLLALVAVLMLRFATASNTQAFEGDYTWVPGDTTAFVTRGFALGSHTSNVVIQTEASVDNSWLFVAYTLVNESTGATIDIGREVSYYHGADSDGSWSEGSSSDAARIPAVPPGTWFLRVSADGTAPGPPILYRVTLRRDAPGALPFIVAFVLLLLPPVFLSIRAHAFETRRWAESDYAPVASDDSDSGGDDD